MSEHHMKYDDWQNKALYEELFEVICEVVCVNVKQFGLQERIILMSL